MAKSFFASPLPRAVVNISLVTAVVGRGTSSCLPNSRASSKSFCIMLTSNQASSGISRTNGPRYFTIGDAITLLSSTSTAVARAMPLFSASSTPSLKASICTARLKLVAIFMETANPFLPTWVTLGPIAARMGRARSKGPSPPPHHDRELPLLQRAHAAGDRGGEHLGSFGRDFGGELCARRRADCAH